MIALSRHLCSPGALIVTREYYITQKTSQRLSHWEVFCCGNSVLRGLYVWPAAGRGLAAAFSGGSLISVITLLGGTLKSIIGRVRGQWLDAHKLPAFAPKSIHVAPGKCAAPLIGDECLQPFGRDPSTIV